jgi:hypothetical protein
LRLLRELETSAGDDQVLVAMRAALATGLTHS